MAVNIVTFDQDPIFIDYINKELKVNFDPADSRTVSHIRKNDDGTYTILAVLLYNRWATHSCEASIASSTKHWISWEYLHACYSYIFNTGRTRINYVVEVDNKAALNLHRKLQHEELTLLRDLFGEGKDAYLFGITKREYEAGRWFKK